MLNLNAAKFPYPKTAKLLCSEDVMFYSSRLLFTTSKLLHLSLKLVKFSGMHGFLGVFAGIYGYCLEFVEVSWIFLQICQYLHFFCIHAQIFGNVLLVIFANICVDLQISVGITEYSWVFQILNGYLPVFDDMEV